MSPGTDSAGRGPTPDFDAMMRAGDRRARIGRYSVIRGLK